MQMDQQFLHACEFELSTWSAMCKALQRLVDCMQTRAGLSKTVGPLLGKGSWLQPAFPELEQWEDAAHSLAAPELTNQAFPPLQLTCWVQKNGCFLFKPWFLQRSCFNPTSSFIYVFAKPLFSLFFYLSTLIKGKCDHSFHCMGKLATHTVNLQFCRAKFLNYIPKILAEWHCTCQ